MSDLALNLPWVMAVCASVLPVLSLLAHYHQHPMPRVLVAVSAVALQNVGVAIAAEHGPNLHLAVALVPVNLGLWLWALAPWLERRVLYQAAFAAVFEVSAIGVMVAGDAMKQLAIAMPIQAMLLFAAGGAALVNGQCRDLPGCRAVGTFLCTYYGVTALAWTVAQHVSGEALWWLFAVRALVHTAAYVRLAWELAQDADQRKAVTA